MAGIRITNVHFFSLHCTCFRTVFTSRILVSAVHMLALCLYCGYLYLWVLVLYLKMYLWYFQSRFLCCALIVSAPQMFELLPHLHCLHTVITRALLTHALLAHTLIVRPLLVLLVCALFDTHCIIARTHIVSLLEHKWYHCIPHIAHICIYNCRHHVVFGDVCHAFVFNWLIWFLFTLL